MGCCNLGSPSRMRLKLTRLLDCMPPGSAADIRSAYNARWEPGSKSQSPTLIAWIPANRITHQSRWVSDNLISLHMVTVQAPEVIIMLDEIRYSGDLIVHILIAYCHLDCPLCLIEVVFNIIGSYLPRVWPSHHHVRWDAVSRNLDDSPFLWVLAIWFRYYTRQVSVLR